MNLLKRKPKYLWKTVKDGLVSDHNNHQWKIGEWQECSGEIRCCSNGFHASDRLIDAMNYVSPGLICKVEAKGKHHEEKDKSAWESMRIIKAYKWEKKDSVALSIYAAEKCLDNFEKVFPDDKRVREAIEAAKTWLKDPTDANASAARSAARSAESAARSAARSAAWSAAWSAARSAAWSAAWSARSAAWSARSARSAAYDKALKKSLDDTEKWLQNHIKDLVEYDN